MRENPTRESALAGRDRAAMPGEAGGGFHSAPRSRLALETLSAPSGSSQTQPLMPDKESIKAGPFTFKRERLMWLNQPQPEAQVARLSITLPTGINTAANSAPVLTLTP